MSLSGQVSEGLEVVTTWRKEDTEEEEEFCVRVQRGEGRGRKGRGEGKGGRGREEKGGGRRERGEGSSEELCARAIEERFVRTGRGTALMLTSDPWL